jgi:hypothetical protein
MAKGKVWTTKRILEQIDRVEKGLPADMEPFYENQLSARNSNIVFEYTDEELGELARCANDVVYFANKYCYSMTDEGIAKITLRDYQKDMLADFQQNRWVVLLASRQIGKTVTSSIFITWYLCFHFDRNIMIVANKAATASEIVDKIKTVLKNLPFFMKPGIVSQGVTGMKFDNGNRMFSAATTKTAAIGFTIHLLYADEFAHVQQNYLVPFYRSIYPTLASSKISRIIISSTANGMDNLFYEIYARAQEGKNFYHPIRVDWWQVPGRDDKWRDQEIANMGSEELFNQEYGNQFLASSRLLLSAERLQIIKRTSKHFVYKDSEDFLDEPDLFEKLRWHPDFDPTSSDCKDKRMVFSVDIGDGVGKDYSVVNVFELEPTSLAMARKVKDFRDETGFFRLNQVGLFHSNTHSVEDLSRVVETLLFKTFNYEYTKIVLEINFKGNIIQERLSKHNDFYPELVLHTRHSVVNEILKPGVKLQKDNKETYCRELRNLANNKRIIIREHNTFHELASFGLNSQGRYSSQGGHDDIAMTCVNAVTFFESNDFYEMVEEMFDNQKVDFKTFVARKLELTGDDEHMDAFRMIRELSEGRANPYDVFDALKKKGNKPF